MVMPTSTSSGTATASLRLLSNEAMSLVDQAKTYRTQMDSLPEDDPRREVYEMVIRDMLERSRRLSSFVANTTSNSSS